MCYQTVVIPNFYDQSFSDLETFCSTYGLQGTAPRLLFNWHYKKNQRKPFAHQDLSKAARSAFSEMFDFSIPQIALVSESADKTVKFLVELQDGLRVETVLIPFQNKYTICLSSQVGCAMGCAFCFTGTQGLKRNLKPHEIVGQFLLAKAWLTENRPGDDRVLNIVFMGQGEPLHNFEATAKAAHIFISQHGLSLATHKITVSTSGYVPGLLRWKNEMPPVNIALSLHALDDSKRSELIPLNKKYPLKDILPLVESIPEGDKRFVTYEYLVLKGFNDSVAEAHELGRVLQGTKAFVNLIPFNPFPGAKYERPALSDVEGIKSILETYKIPVTLRTTKGDEILAACGQLNTILK
jgi:23S rRNA (adenine2503-C2)-methyltransferase